MLKYDGWRMGCVIESGRARLVSRNARGWSDSFPTVCQAALRLPLRAALLDGELAVLLPNGLTSFQALQNRTALPPNSQLVLQAFDLLHLDGEDLDRRPLVERKALLERVLASEVRVGVIRYTPHIVGDGPRVLAHACALGAEGIVSKRLDAPYTSGRTRDWLKSKCVCAEPFVIGGFTVSGDAVGALLVGEYNTAGELRYAGSVGTGKGFTRELLRELRNQLRAFEVPQSPFVRFSPATLRSQWGKRHALPTRWVSPVVVANVSFLERAEGQLRHASFQGLRDDLRAHEVVRH
ncbi:MAG TPA: non-homologous end-joining DNA ligase [Polyangiales bacterium]|nr:non-homologous end-joining DNA ligase [Polyangiales bacterium]